MVKEEFIQEKGKIYKFQIGKRIAATLTGFIAGFIAGAIAASIIVYLIMMKYYVLR